MKEYSEDIPNAFEITRPFVNEVIDDGDVQLIGGLGIEPLLHAGMSINMDAKEVIVPEPLFLPAHREDGTKRDVDVLVLSSQPGRIQQVGELLNTSVEDHLEQSVFSIRTHEALQKRLAHPFGMRAMTTFVSDRYEAAPDAPTPFVKALPPFSLPIDPESLETWTAVTPNGTHRVPIPHPGATILNYTNRSISGLRSRDVDKATRAAVNVFAKAPEVKEWIVDGPGASQFELSRIIASLRAPSMIHFPVVDGLTTTTYSWEELTEHEAFVAEARPIARAHLIAGAAFKASGLAFFEKYPIIVTGWRQFAEKRADDIVKNA